eukprot:CAMPEP_0197652140 /NCGR_PEP_ID=MMETSP1338-20131121/34262_1 /TAXON_ID=43686 ORGANISM="Pelagodinium beii, Strain RCC1491" /NCGR_SAMPLE_ID=MMETSP1338 /ASSEMBLY_ACC=CAM_ASM_000754 /LENGTH=697 /DNA_ID=CAMNT_0043226945 /DNA_START=83 /DNA_END=2176 /DNA_ORIENTATION=-
MKHFTTLAALLASSMMLLSVAENATANATQSSASSFAQMVTLQDGQMDVASMEESILLLAQEGDPTDELLPFLDEVFNLTGEMKWKVVLLWNSTQAEIHACWEDWWNCEKKIPSPANIHRCNETHWNCSRNESNITVNHTKCKWICDQKNCTSRCPPYTPPYPFPRPCPVNPTLPAGDVCDPKCGNWPSPWHAYQAIRDEYQDLLTSWNNKVDDCEECEEVLISCYEECEVIYEIYYIKWTECRDHQRECEKLICDCEHGNCTDYYSCYNIHKNKCPGLCPDTRKERILRAEYEGLLRIECYLRVLVDHINMTEAEKKAEGWLLSREIEKCRKISPDEYFAIEEVVPFPVPIGFPNPNGTGWIKFTCPNNPPIKTCPGESCVTPYLPCELGFIQHYYLGMPEHTGPEPSICCPRNGGTVSIIPLRPSMEVRFMRRFKALTWDGGAMDLTDVSDDPEGKQRWIIHKCKEKTMNCLTDQSLWTTAADRNSHEIFSGDLVALVNQKSGKTFDCHTTCTETSFPPRPGHWAALYLIFKVDSAGNKVGTGNKIGIYDAVYFHGMKALNQWEAFTQYTRVIDCSVDQFGASSCGTGVDGASPGKSAFVIEQDGRDSRFTEGLMVAPSVQGQWCSSLSAAPLTLANAKTLCQTDHKCFTLLSLSPNCETDGGVNDRWQLCDHIVTELVAASGTEELSACTVQKI